MIITSSYFVLWPNDWCRRLAQANDYGPLQAVYGGPHTSVPSLGKVAIGDYIYPVSIRNGELFILGRMEVDSIMDAEVYLEKQNISKSYGELWDVIASDLLKQRPALGHRIPRTCIDHVAIGCGTGFRFDFNIPTQIVGTLRFGPKPGQERELPKNKEEKPHLMALQGHFRRLSTDSAALVASLMQNF